MTPLGLSKLAPKGTPLSVARYLDDAAEYLRPLAEDCALDLKPYDLIHPDVGTWAHHLYGKAWDREFAIQVAANDRDAPDFHATVSGFVKHYAKGDDHWVRMDFRQVNGMAGLLICVDDFLHALRLVCTLRMPHATDPDLKA